MLHYDFTFMNNKYDSYKLELRLDFDIYDPKVEDMLEPTEDLKLVQRFKLKENQLNYLFMGYLRSALREDFITGKDMRPTDLLVTEPKILDFEKVCLQKYCDIITECLNRRPDFDHDKATLGADLSHHKRVAVTFRHEQTKILISQLNTIRYLVDIFTKFCDIQGAPNKSDLFREIYMKKAEHEDDDSFVYLRLQLADYLRQIYYLL